MFVLWERIHTAGTKATAQAHYFWCMTINRLKSKWRDWWTGEKMFVKCGDEIKLWPKTIDNFGQLPICVTQTWWMLLINRALQTRLSENNSKFNTALGVPLRNTLFLLLRVISSNLSSHVNENLGAQNPRLLSELLCEANHKIVCLKTYCLQNWRKKNVQEVEKGTPWCLCGLWQTAIAELGAGGFVLQGGAQVQSQSAANWQSSVMPRSSGCLGSSQHPKK